MKITPLGIISDVPYYKMKKKVENSQKYIYKTKASAWYAPLILSKSIAL